MSEVHLIENPAKFIRDSGLLFEINCKIFRPLGLVLAVTTDDSDNEEGKFYILDCQNEYGDRLFPPEAFNEGKEKFDKFAKERKEYLEKRHMTPCSN